MTEHFNVDGLAAMDILEAWGIDAFECFKEGFGETGYLMRRKDAFGTPVYDENRGWILDQYVWPKGFPRETFLEYVGKWQAAEGARK